MQNSNFWTTGLFVAVVVAVAYWGMGWFSTSYMTEQIRNKAESVEYKEFKGVDWRNGSPYPQMDYR